MTDLEIQTMRCDRALLQRELESAGVQFKGKYCRCPFHDDAHPSADIYERDGVWRFHCFPCDKDGDIFDVRSWLNKSTVDNEIGLETMRRAQPHKAAPPRPMPPVEPLIEQARAVVAGTVGEKPTSGPGNTLTTPG